MPLVSTMFLNFDYRWVEILVPNSHIFCSVIFRSYDFSFSSSVRRPSSINNCAYRGRPEARRTSDDDWTYCCDPAGNRKGSSLAHSTASRTMLATMTPRRGATAVSLTFWHRWRKPGRPPNVSCGQTSYSAEAAGMTCENKHVGRRDVADTIWALPHLSRPLVAH